MRRTGKAWVILAAVAVIGLLLAAWLVGSDTFADDNQVAMEATYRNYDWGITKPGGRPAENRHRAHLNEQFRATIRDYGSLIRLTVTLPDPLNFQGQAADKDDNETVVYELERVFHKYVDSQTACDNKLTADALLLEEHMFAISRPRLAEPVRASVDINRFDANQGQYSCLVVKLKGAIQRSPDTHPEWAFVSPMPIPKLVTWPMIEAVSDERGARAYSLAGASGLRFYWSYRILETWSNRCDASAFATLLPIIRASTARIIFRMPESQTARDYYRNRLICFQAVDCQHRPS